MRQRSHERHSDFTETGKGLSMEGIQKRSGGRPSSDPAPPALPQCSERAGLW
jgi:hypothetical protein